MTRHVLAGLFAGILAATCTWTVLPSHADPAPKGEVAKRGLSDKAYMGIMYEILPDNTLKLTQVHIATPAWDAGLTIGDVILGVETLQDGKTLKDQLAPPTFLLAGLSTAAPGTEFKMKIRRGEASLKAERAFCLDFPKNKLEIPAAQTFVSHIQQVMKDWDLEDEVWVTVKTCSFKEFSEFHQREQQAEVMRLQILELQVRMEKEQVEIKAAYENIKRLIAERKLAEAQTALAEVQQTQAGFGICQTIFSLLKMFFF